MVKKKETKKKVVKKKITKKKPKEDKNVHVIENTTTPTLPTTTYYIKSWGYYNKYKNIIIEQITPRKFLYNINGKKGIVEVRNFGKEDGYGFIIEDSLYLFEKRIYPAFQFYNVPSMNMCEKYLNGKYKPRKYKEIKEDIENVLTQMFDFSGDVDINTSNLSISQSWIKPILNEFFFFGIDSTKGGGKTTLGEIVYFLMRHGFVGGNISSASIPRLINELDLNIFVDEIDQNKSDDETMAILRKGQRRGNPYVRCEGRDNHPVAYDLAGCHGFSYRSELEDAFMDRALRTHTTKSNDYMLPVINSSKKEILKPLADELFFWFIENICVVGCSRVYKDEKSNLLPTIKNKSQRENKGVVTWDMTPTTIFKKKLFNRSELYKNLVRNMNDDEKDFLKKVFGRDNELTFLCLKTAKLLGFDMIEDIKKIIEKKKTDESSSESFYLETLKEFIVLKQHEILSKQLKDGDNFGCSFFPKSKLYQQFVKYLSDLKIMSIGTKKFSSYLRDIGFVEGVSIRSQRYESYPTGCLIFTDDILRKIGIVPQPIPKIPPKEEEELSGVLEDFEK